LRQNEDSHGRLENRQYHYAPIGPVEAGLPYARGAWQSTRTWLEKKTIKEGRTEFQSHTRRFLSSLSPGDDPSERKRGARAIRGHWGTENKNHDKRDTCQWREDGHRYRRVNAVAVKRVG
jgi:hypothetical protein